MDKKIIVKEDSNHDMLQIDQAARGCISGTLEEWPDLDCALRKYNIFLPKDTIARTLQEICRLINVRFEYRKLKENSFNGDNSLTLH